MTKYLASIAPERNIELINAKVKIRLEHGNAIIMHPFVRQVKILSSTRMKETGTYQVVINLVHGIKCRTLLDIGVGSSYISSTIVSKLNKQPVRRGTKKIEMMLYTTNNKLSIYYVTIKNLEDDFKFTKETNAINKDVLLNMPNPDYGRVQNMEEYKIPPPHRNQDE